MNRTALSTFGPRSRRPAPLAAPAVAPVSAETTRLWRWLYGFVLYQMALQLVLVLADLGSLRTVLRVGAFLPSLVLLFVFQRAERRHPARPWLVGVMVLLGLSIFHPETDGLVAGAAQAALYVAILAPVFWVTRLQLEAPALKRLLLMFWGFHAIGSVLGVLQVYFPGRFQPSVAGALSARGDDYLESLMFEAASGERVFRPMGLTDAPGGAATSGFYVVLLGVGLLMTIRDLKFRILCLATMVAGMASVYLSHVRVALVMLLVALFAVGALFALRGHFERLFQYALVLGLVVGVGLSVSLTLGGDAVARRLNTLVADDASEVYYSNRGHFLDHTVSELLPEYPLGAGLGRWGMMNAYFGARKVRPIWVEVQWTGWLLDGGVPLVLAYVIALALAMWVAFKIALGKLGSDPSLWVWGVVLFGYNLGTLALTFSYPIFISQSGMEFWLLNAALFCAAAPRIAPALSRAGRPGAPPVRVASGGRLR